MLPTKSSGRDRIDQALGLGQVYNANVAVTEPHIWFCGSAESLDSIFLFRNIFDAICVKKNLLEQFPWGITHAKCLLVS